MNPHLGSDPVFGFSHAPVSCITGLVPKNRKPGLTPAGFTLAEMMVVMTVSSTLLVLATGMVHQTMTLQSRGRQLGARQQTALRLASQFRHDVQRSRQASLQRDGTALIFESRRPGESAVTYNAEDGQVLRAQLRANGQHQRESFRFTPGDQAHFELLPGPRRAVLVITHPIEQVGDKPRLELHVEAVVGRHRTGLFAENVLPMENSP
jgi:prepilin-type N-terminal cleavage/methylation domain-containing protein